MLALHNGDLLAFSEARRNSCGDFAPTDILSKRSADKGATWGKAHVVRALRQEEGLVVGNASPVQLSQGNPFFPGRIVLPHIVDDRAQWVMHSDDGGETWSTPHRVLEKEQPKEWNWICSGPPGSIELSSSHPIAPYRILVPSHHGLRHGNLLNDFTHGHSIYSDDGGQSWKFGKFGYGPAHPEHSAEKMGPPSGNYSSINSLEEDGPEVSPEGRGIYVSENQYVELSDGRVLASARNLALPPLGNMHRIQAISRDGGVSFSEGLRPVPELVNSLTGNEGSILRDTRRNILYYSGTYDRIYRTHLSVFRSTNDGDTWQRIVLIDPFMSGYSSIQIIHRPAASGSLLRSSSDTDILAVLYEQCDKRQLVMAPDRFMFKQYSLEHLAQLPPLPSADVPKSGNDDAIAAVVWI